MASKKNRKGRSTAKLSAFVALEHYMLNSPAWLSLPPPARSAFIAIAKIYNGQNNGRLAMSGRMIEKLMPVSRQTGVRALKELCMRGFIEIVTPCGFNMKSGAGRATEFRLTCHKCDVTQQLPSKAFMRWKPNTKNAASPKRQVGLTTHPTAENTRPIDQNMDAK